MADCRSVLCGDLNSNRIWDHQHSHASHSDVVNQLTKIGMSSLYHSTFGEEQGKERQKTFFMYRKQDLKYQFHIDYAFLSSDLIDPASGSISIGTFEEWIPHSDHVPIEFSVDVAGAGVKAVVGSSGESK
jgi:exonuclease III